MDLEKTYALRSSSDGPGDRHQYHRPGSGLYYRCERANRGRTSGGRYHDHDLSRMPAGRLHSGRSEKETESVPGVAKATVNITFEPPWEPSMMSEEALLDTGMFGMI